MGRIRLFPLLFQNGCSQSSRFPTAGQGERGSGKEIEQVIKLYMHGPESKHEQSGTIKKKIILYTLALQ